MEECFPGNIVNFVVGSVEKIIGNVIGKPIILIKKMRNSPLDTAPVINTISIIGRRNELDMNLNAWCTTMIATSPSLRQ